MNSVAARSALLEARVALTDLGTDVDMRDLLALQRDLRERIDVEQSRLLRDPEALRKALRP